MTPEELRDRLLTFAARIGKVVDALPETRMGRHIAGQLPEHRLGELLGECGQLGNIIGKSLVTAMANKKKRT